MNPIERWTSKLSKSFAETAASKFDWYVVEWKKSQRATKWNFISAFGDEKMAENYAKTQQSGLNNGEIVRVRGSHEPK